MMNLEGREVAQPSMSDLEPADKWIISALNTLAKDMTENMDKFELGIAVQKVYDFIWDEFCDWYIEIAKQRIYQYEKVPAAANAALWTLRMVLTEALKLLHPFMPFITEEIFCTLHPEETSIMLAQWPEYKEERHYEAEENILSHVKDIVKAVRTVRKDMNVPNSRKAKLFVVSGDVQIREIFENAKESYQSFTYANEISVQADREGIPENAVSVVIPDAAVYIPLEELVDKAKELERLMKDKEKLEKELARSNGMLKNEKFLSKAPHEKIEEEKKKLEKYEKMKAEVEKRLAQMQ